MYDAGAAGLLREYLHAWRPALLHLRGEEVNIPVLLESLVIARGISYDAYVDRFVERSRARLAVTSTDNDVSFYSLASRHQRVRTMFVQNGTRSNYGDVFEKLKARVGDKSAMAVDRMLTFGGAVGSEYAKHIRGHAVPIGSLKNNHVPRRAATRPGTLMFVSQFRDGDGPEIAGKQYSHEEYFERADALVLDFLKEYAQSRGKRLSVMLCSALDTVETGRPEREYFDRLLDCKFDAHEQTTLTEAYDQADSAEVVVTIDSTLGYESAARGNRTAIFSVRFGADPASGFTFGWPGQFPDEGPFWTNHPDTSAFERILDHLFEIDDDQWRQELVACGFDHVMKFDPGNSILRGVLQEELGDPPASQPQAAPIPDNVQR